MLAYVLRRLAATLAKGFRVEGDGEIRLGALCTIDELAVVCGVTTRTIRRDLQALEEAGFPLYDDRQGEDGRTRWRLNGQPFKGLSAGLTLSELCALYFSRSLLESLAGTPFREEVESAFDSLASLARDYAGAA